MTSLERTKHCLAYQDACKQYEDLLQRYRARYVDLLAKAQEEIHRLHVKIINLENRNYINNIHAQESDTETEPESESDPSSPNEVIDLTE